VIPLINGIGSWTGTAADPGIPDDPCDPGTPDEFIFRVSTTGRAFVRVSSDVDGLEHIDEEFSVATTPGQSFRVEVTRFPHSPVFKLTILAIADDVPDDTFKTIKLNPTTHSASQAGTINYGGDEAVDRDEDVFRFKVTKTGLMTLKLQDDRSDFTLSVRSVPLAQNVPFVIVSKPTVVLDPSPKILQFEVVEGAEYEVRVSNAHVFSENYRLSFAIGDDFSDTVAKSITLKAGPTTQTGSIETPDDQDRFKFTARNTGYVIVALSPAFGTGMQGRLTFPTDANPLAPITVEYLPNTTGYLPNTSVEDGYNVFSKVGFGGATRNHFVVLQVTRGQTYEFLVSGDQDTIGDYEVKLYSTRLSVPMEFEAESSIPGHFITDTLKFSRPSTSPSSSSIQLTVGTSEDGIVFPEPGGQFAGPPNTKLVVSPLPPANTGGTPGTVTVPSGQATLAGNSLINTLLVVAARDNAVRPTENVVASQGTADVAATLFAALLTGVIAPATGGTDGATDPGTDASTAPPIRGTVFEDLDGNGRLDTGEPGLAGEKIVLEVQQNGQYVVVATALTDAKGAYSFAEVPAGEYRVRRLVQASSGSSPATATSYPVKVTGESKPKTLDFGKPGKRGRTQLDRPAPALGGTAAQFAWHEDAAIAPELGQVFQDWCDLDEPDDAPTGWWLALLPLAAAVALARPERLLQTRESE